MAWRTEKNSAGNQEIVIDGFEQGIAASPYLGLGDARNVNLNSALGSAGVMFSTTALTLPPSGYIGVSFNGSASSDVINTSTTSGFYNGMGVLMVTLSTGSAGLTVGRTYYVNNLTATSFKLYDNLGADSLIDISTNVTGTFTVKTFGTPTDSINVSDALTSVTSDSGIVTSANIIMTSDGLLWYVRAIGSTAFILQSLGNNSHSTVGSYQSGMAEFNEYLFAFYGTRIDYIDMDHIDPTTASNPSANWVYGWKTDLTNSVFGHNAIPATDDVLYFCNAGQVGSIIHVAGTTFDPTDPSTYTYSTSALLLPSGDYAKCLNQLGTNLLIGGAKNYIYPWDRISTSFNYPLICAENNIKQIVSSNSSSYIFAGNRGRVYITNGANIDLFHKFPDTVSGTEEPYYYWDDAIYHKNNLYFSLYGKDNSGTAISTLAGVWALDLDTNALRMSNKPSYSGYAGRVTTISQILSFSPPGDGLMLGWVDGSSAGGVDRTQVNPYTSYESYIDSDLIPIGTYLNKTTSSNIEFKLAKPLVSGESVRLSYRGNLTDSFTTINTFSTAGQISAVFPVNFQKMQWLQIRAELSSTTSSPSYLFLREIRIR